LSERALDSALKLYLAIKSHVEADPAVQGVGINCLNESHFSDTTPCLAWSLLFEEKKLTWGCEADTLSMLTQHLLFRTLGVPLMMTNLYPFSMGQAALKHEHIPSFPESSDPENHILVAHCGYLGVVPRPFAEGWRLREKVLAIVDDNASAIDARIPTGDITLVKLHPLLNHWSVAEGTLEGYVQYENSHCLNGGVIKVDHGRRFMRELISHHYILAAGHIAERLRWASRVFELDVECL
jgi:L-fucose isomerase-like protein